MFHPTPLHTRTKLKSSFFLRVWCLSNSNCRSIKGQKELLYLSQMPSGFWGFFFYGFVLVSCGGVFVEKVSLFLFKLGFNWGLFWYFCVRMGKRFLYWKLVKCTHYYISYSIIFHTLFQNRIYFFLNLNLCGVSFRILLLFFFTYAIAQWICDIT